VQVRAAILNLQKKNLNQKYGVLKIADYVPGSLGAIASSYFQIHSTAFF